MIGLNDKLNTSLPLYESLLSDEEDLLGSMDDRVVSDQADTILKNHMHPFYKYYKITSMVQEDARFLKNHIVHFTNPVNIGDGYNEFPPLRYFIPLADTISSDNIIKIRPARGSKELTDKTICKNIKARKIQFDLASVETVSNINMQIDYNQAKGAAYSYGLSFGAIFARQLLLSNINIHTPNSCKFQIRFNIDTIPEFKNVHINTPCIMSLYSLDFPDADSPITKAINKCLDLDYMGVYEDTTKNTTVNRKSDIKTLQATLNRTNVKRYKPTAPMFKIKRGMKITDMFKGLPKNVQKFSIQNNSVRLVYTNQVNEMKKNDYTVGYFDDGWVLMIYPNY